jgi:hypothetical protein
MKRPLALTLALTAPLTVAHCSLLTAHCFFA